MFNHLSKKIVEHYCKKDSNEIELYVFGVNQGLNMILNIVTALFIGILFGEFFQALLFMFAYIPLRSYAGGYHTETPLRCYIFSIILLTVVLIGIKYISAPDLVYYFVLIMALFIVILLSPVENKNKPLDKTEYKIYKKRVIFITITEFAIGQLLNLIGLYNMFVTVVYSFVVLSFMLITGKAKNCVLMKPANKIIPKKKQEKYGE